MSSTIHFPFDPDSVDWSEFFEKQVGGSFYFEGIPYQRGGGLGSIFSSLYRFLLPIGKSIGRELGKEGLEAGSRLLNRLSTGEDLKNSLINESQQGLKNVIDRVYEERKKKSQQGTGKAKRKKTIKGSTNTKKSKIRVSKIGPPKRIDYLGAY